jgi:aryl-alcohol dehydrogenase-like predicted oxidoreductase
LPTGRASRPRPGEFYDIIELVVVIAESRGISAAQVALAWLIGRPGVTAVIIGARTDARLQDNLKAADIVLTTEERARLLSEGTRDYR